METSDYWILIIGFSLIVGGAYGSYRMGRTQERKDLTEALTKQLEGMYYDGYYDAKKECK